MTPPLRQTLGVVVIVEEGSRKKYFDAKNVTKNIKVLAIVRAGWGRVTLRDVECRERSDWCEHVGRAGAGGVILLATLLVGGR